MLLGSSKISEEKKRLQCIYMQNKQRILYILLVSVLIGIVITWILNKNKETYMYGSHENRPWRTVHEYMLPAHRHVRKFRQQFAMKLEKTPSKIMPCGDPLRNYTPDMISDIVGVPSDSHDQRSLLWKNLNEALRETCRRHFPQSRQVTSSDMASVLIRLNNRGSNMS